jgi:hypothetical protein
MRWQHVLASGLLGFALHSRTLDVPTQAIGGVHNAMPVAVPALEHLKINYRTHSGIMNVSRLDDMVHRSSEQD